MVPADCRIKCRCRVNARYNCLWPGKEGWSDTCHVRLGLYQYRPGDYETWKFIAPIQRAAWKRKTFEDSTWGGEIRSELKPHPGDVVAAEHWCSSGFADTDVDLQLKKHGIHKIIVVGLIAHTCVEATVRFAAELGYDVTMVKDATAGLLG